MTKSQLYVRQLVIGRSISIGKRRFIFEVSVSVYIGIGKVLGIGILVWVLNILYRYQDKMLLKTSNLRSLFN